MVTQWQLKRFMDDHEIRPGDLARHTRGRLSRTSIYGLMKERPRGINFSTLDVLLPALSRMLGREVEIGELITHGRETAGPPAPPESYLDFAGTFDDPNSPGDVAINHDKYLGEALMEEHEEGLAGKR